MTETDSEITRLRAELAVRDAEVVRLRKGLEAANALNEIVEGIDGTIKHGTWRDEKGMRLKDTPEWVAFYNARALLTAPSAPDHTARKGEQRTICEDCGNSNLAHDRAVWTDDGASYCPSCRTASFAPESGWRPIETAPSGEPLLVTMKGFLMLPNVLTKDAEDGQWYESAVDGRQLSSPDLLVAWMPLPPPPKKENE